MSLVENCTVCDRKVQSFSIHLRCIHCKSKHHAKCVNFDRDDVVNCEPWYCPTCMKSIFVYNHYDDDDEFLSAILEGVIDSTARFHEMNSQIFYPFEINEFINTSLAETDPDIQFYSENNYIRNSNCDYYLEETFNNNLKKKTLSGNAMSFFM